MRLDPYDGGGPDARVIALAAVLLAILWAWLVGEGLYLMRI